MKGKQLLLLLLLVAVLGAAGYHLQKGNESSWSKTGGGGAGGKVVDFPINEVAQVHVKSASGEVNIVRKDDEWTVQERADFPANYEQVSGLVRKLWDLKTVQEVKVGPSQMPRLELVEPGQGDAAGTVVELKDKDGKKVGGLLLGKKHMRKSEGPTGPMGDMGGFPSGRYVAPLGGTKVSLVSESLDEVESKPERWLRKDFIKVENPKSLAVTGTTPGMNWKLLRESTTADWKFADAASSTGTAAVKPDATKPKESSPSEPKPADSKPGEPKPPEPKPPEPKPPEPKPPEPKSPEPKPPEPKPADAKPPEPKPAPADGNAAKPAEPKPPENNPCETPADPKPEAEIPAAPAPTDVPAAAPAPAKPADPVPTPAKPGAPNPASAPNPPPSGEGKPVPAPTGDQLDKSKVSQFGTLFSSPSFKDVLAPDAKPEDNGLDKPTTVTIETFDHFTYALSIGKLINDAYPVRFTVSADLPKERTPGKDEKPEDKTKLDDEFKASQKKFEEKLATEKKLEGRVYLLEKFTVEPLLKERSALLVEAKPETPAAPPAATPPISVTTPPVSAPPSATTPPISVTTPPVTAPPAKAAPSPAPPPAPSPAPPPAPSPAPEASDPPKP